MRGLFLFCFTALVYTALAQPSKRANIWYFGQNAGLDFNDDEPRVLTDGQINTDEGSAVISDESGNLLFYTDGETIWNREHQIMSNGEGLKGSFTSTQSALIVPRPGSDRLYYVFTTAAQGGPDGFNYSIVDMTGDDGLGGVITKNVLLYTPTTEKLTAVHHANGRDVWVITHKWESDEFYVYLITEEGLDETPVISATGSRHEFNPGNTIGQMKVSSSGDIIALNLWSDLITEVFSFDHSSGLVKFSKTYTIDTSYPAETGVHISGLEISVNSKYIYLGEEASSLYSPQNIYQLNISSGKQIKIAQVFIGGNLQLANNGKIYCVNADRPELFVIESPNLCAEFAGFKVERYEMNPLKNRLGLPNFIQSYFAVADPSVEMPNVFTPNEDGVNDRFVPTAFERIETFQLKVVNRSGTPVHETTSPEQWWDGGGYPSGTYFWYLQYEGVNGNSGKLNGWVQLLR